MKLKGGSRKEITPVTVSVEFLDAINKHRNFISDSTHEFTSDLQYHHFALLHREKWTFEHKLGRRHRTVSKHTLNPRAQHT